MTGVYNSWKGNAMYGCVADMHLDFSNWLISTNCYYNQLPRNSCAEKGVIFCESMKLYLCFAVVTMIFFYRENMFFFLQVSNGHRFSRH